MLSKGSRKNIIKTNLLVSTITPLLKELRVSTGMPSLGKPDED